MDALEAETFQAGGGMEASRIQIIEKEASIAPAPLVFIPAMGFQLA